MTDADDLVALRQDAGVVETSAPRMGVLGMAYRQFLARPAPGRDWLGVVWWWDSRRLVYSLIVLLTALLTTAGAALRFLGGAGTAFAADPDYSKWVTMPLALIGWPAFLMCAANAWYTGGWIAELALRLVIKDRVLWLGVALLAAGIVFSIGFTVWITITLASTWA